MVVEEVPEMRIAVDHGRGSGAPERLQRVLVVDVDLGDRGEVGAQPVPMVVETVLEQRGSVAASSRGVRNPGGGSTRTLGGILELQVQVGEVFEGPRGGVGRDTVPAVRDRAAGGVEVFEQLHERPVTIVVTGRIHRGHAHGERRRELGVETRLLRAHVAAGEGVPTFRVERRQLAEHQLGHTSGLVEGERAVARACS